MSTSTVVSSGVTSPRKSSVPQRKRSDHHQEVVAKLVASGMLPEAAEQLMQTRWSEGGAMGSIPGRCPRGFLAADGLVRARAPHAFDPEVVANCEHHFQHDGGYVYCILHVRHIAPCCRSWLVHCLNQGAQMPQINASGPPFLLSLHDTE